MKELIKKFIPDFLLGFYHYSLVLISAFLYGFPSRKMTIIGVTGTSGKSTVVELTARIFEEALRQRLRLSGSAERPQGKQFKIASLSSIKFKIGDKEWENRLKMTMPGRMKLQRFLRQAVKVGCEYVVLEVTSEGIKQFRHKFIDFDVAVLTNLSPEHIEAHGGFKKYRKAKAKLFQQTKKIHIINADDKNAEYFLKIPAKQKIKYGINDKNLLPEHFNLLGNFNLYNAITASKIAMSQGVSLETCKRALEKVKGIPGRMEIVNKEPFTVVVDYAHTPQSLKKVYETLRNPKSQIPNPKQTPNLSGQNSKLICVLGSCGGGRDKWKRPVLGKIAAQYCQEIIVTNEDPYDEDPKQILSMIKSGIPNSKFQIPNFYEILDRREAIKKALELAKPQDVVVITGKGSEPWMCVAKGKKISWDDRQIAKEEFQKIQK